MDTGFTRKSTAQFRRNRSNGEKLEKEERVETHTRTLKDNKLCTLQVPL